MTHIEQAIRDAVEKGGYRPLLELEDHTVLGDVERIVSAYDYDAGLQSQAFLDPKFWQALGKARGWEAEITWDDGSPRFRAEWKDKWHRFIDHLADGKDAESFFASL